jgi:hypothetical protein
MGQVALSPLPEINAHLTRFSVLTSARQVESLQFHGARIRPEEILEFMLVSRRRNRV